MAGNTKVLRQRIKSVTSTLQLTKAMGLIASSKIYRANEAMKKAREYTAAFEETIVQLTSDGETAKSPFMAKRDSGRIRLIVIAGDRGLAGGYNANVFRLCREYPQAQFIPVGKRACDRFGGEVNSSERFSYADAAVLAQTLCEDFKNGEYDALGVVFTRYRSVLTQDADVKWLLPLTRREDAPTVATVFEPDHLTVLNLTVREYVAGVITACAIESFACEVSARRTAMDSAEKNAKQMIDDLSLEYNRARQSAITQEITEIVAGSGSE